MDKGKAMSQGLRTNGTRDLRLFFVCPRCGSTRINFIRHLEKGVQFFGNKKIKEVVVVMAGYGLTVCVRCGYSKQGVRNEQQEAPQRF